MRPVTAIELTQRMTDMAASIRASIDPIASLGVISMMLVLKCASDQPGVLHIPDRIQWRGIVSISEGREPGRQLYEAMKELEQSNPDVLGNVFNSLSFPAELKRADVKVLVDSFSLISLSNEDLEFPDSVGEAYDRFLDYGIGIITRQSNEHDTPRVLADLMVRLIELGAGQSVCDPFASVAGVLIAAGEYVNDQGEGSVGIYGQEFDRYQWAAAKISLFLHGFPNVNLLYGDSLSDPSPVTDEGMLMRFDRVLGRPPLGRSHQQKGVRYPERMRYGWTSSRGRADLMYVQHALAILNPSGIGAIISPQGVLFRSGAEAEIRRGIVEDGRIKAVISLGSNIFQATSIPTCILVFQGLDQRDSQHRKVFFIDAEQEMVTGRTQRRLEPEAAEKIIGVFQERQELPGFSRLVSFEEIADNNFNLSVRRYVEAGLPANPPPDAGAVISGGVPRAEVEAEVDRFRAFGIDLVSLFVTRDASYLDFPPSGYQATAVSIPDFAKTREHEFMGQCQQWWTASAPNIVELASTHQLLRSQSQLISSFSTQLSSAGILNSYQLSGAFASWWAARYKDLRILNQAGFQAVLSRWDAAGADRLSLLPESEAREQVLARLGADLCAITRTLVASERQKLVDIYRSWGERYATSLASLEAQRDAAVARLRVRLQDLGY